MDELIQTLVRRAKTGDPQARQSAIMAMCRSFELEKLEELRDSDRSEIIVLESLLIKRRAQGVERDYQALEPQAYANAIAALHESILDGAAPFQPTYQTPEGQTVARAQSAAEIMDMCLEDFYTKTNPGDSPRSFDERLALLDVYKDSITGVANKGKEKLCKIIPVCRQLITITLEQVTEENDSVLPVVFDDLPGEALPTDLVHADGTPMANGPQTKEQTYSNQYWLAGADHDGNRLRAYTDVVHAGFEHRKKTQNWKYDGHAMIFWLHEQTRTDQLRALFINYLDNYSVAGGGSVLDGDARLFRVAQRESP